MQHQNASAWWQLKHPWMRGWLFLAKDSVPNAFQWCYIATQNAPSDDPTSTKSLYTTKHTIWSPLPNSVIPSYILQPICSVKWTGSHLNASNQAQQCLIRPSEDESKSRHSPFLVKIPVRIRDIRSLFWTYKLKRKRLTNSKRDKENRLNLTPASSVYFIPNAEFRISTEE